MMMDYMTIDGVVVPIEGEKNVLEVIRKAGIEMPTFCYYSDLSVYGACRMCVVETGVGRVAIEASCSTPPVAGMVVRTNTGRLRRYRTLILELLLSSHCRDCTSCPKDRKCRLQDLASRFKVRTGRFENTAAESLIDDSSFCITRDAHKCILCGDCVRVCNEIQGVGAIEFTGRGSNMRVSAPFDMPIAESACVGCGQCSAVCPTGALTVRDDTAAVWRALDDAAALVSVQVAPAVRAAIAKEFGMHEDSNAIGRIFAALRRLGFDRVYDTATGADLTVIEEGAELVRRLQDGKAHEWPLFSSCCPAWVQFVEKEYPALLGDLSSCKSPMQMFASVIRETEKAVVATGEADGARGGAADGGAARGYARHVHVAVMPCTAKKFEAARAEFKAEGEPAVDYVITTGELIQMIREAGIVFDALVPELADRPFGEASGGGVIFGVSGGVTEAALRSIAEDKSPQALMRIAYTGVRGMEGIKEAQVTVGDRVVRIAVVSGLQNVREIIRRIKAGERYDFVEVMSCRGGCVSGGGQPFAASADKEGRSRNLYARDKRAPFPSSERNPVVRELYERGVLKGRAHELLHVDYRG
ncbi:MAG: [FeFe] hydrogenase, group A [Spirochaetaceae bacterium]|nr:[FeFe] hydrogenase, group A [Spirochaetaceae bacterium]